MIFLEQIKNQAAVFTVGAIGYSAIIEKAFPHIKYLYKCIMGSLTITTVELCFGIVFNILLCKNVWDYSQIKFNFLGQICLLYTVLWGFLTALALPISKKLISALQK